MRTNLPTVQMRVELRRTLADQVKDYLAHGGRIEIVHSGLRGTEAAYNRGPLQDDLADPLLGQLIGKNTPDQ